MEKLTERMSIRCTETRKLEVEKLAGKDGRTFNNWANHFFALYLPLERKRLKGKRDTRKSKIKAKPKKA